MVGAGREQGGPFDQIKSVTLLVTPQAAARLTLGQSRGKLCLALRNYSDEDQSSTRPV